MLLFTNPMKQTHSGEPTLLASQTKFQIIAQIFKFPFQQSYLWDQLPHQYPGERQCLENSALDTDCCLLWFLCENIIFNVNTFSITSLPTSVLSRKLAIFSQKDKEIKCWWNLRFLVWLTDAHRIGWWWRCHWSKSVIVRYVFCMFNISHHLSIILNHSLDPATWTREINIF